MTASGFIVGCFVTLFGCGFLTFIGFAAGAYFFRGQILNAGLTAAGFEQAGQTEQIVAEAAQLPIPTAPPVIAPAMPTTVAFSAPQANIGAVSVPSQQQAAVSVGQDNTGTDIASVQLSEGDLLDLCAEYSTVCSSQGETVEGVTIRNVYPDLKQNSAIIYADIIAADFPVAQRVGVVVQVGGAGDTLVFRGIDINGTLYSSAPDEQLNALLDEAERELNNGLRQFVLEADGRTYQIDRIVIDETQIVVVLR